MAGVLYLLELQPPEAAMLVGCFLAAVAHPDHAAELAMFDKLPSEARMAVGRFFSFFPAGGRTMPGAKSCIRTCRHGLSVSADFGEWPDSSTRAGQGMDRGRCWLAGRPRTPENLSHTTQLPLLR
ncbi:hypothetical protein J4732_15260 [Serratia marcescens]|uniref:Uncharacterized protein n=1 Tax=Serratia marcescens TaxID=615 RepID=A0A939NME6_SERMA|nr:hypothetical protein [Serratia marcescens]